MVKSNFEEHLIHEAKKDDIVRFVVGAVIKNLNKILVLGRKDDDFFGGIDELPSGEVETGESLIDALKREILEETGLIINDTPVYIGYFDYLSKSGKSTRQFNFVVSVNNNFVRINPEEHKCYKWIDFSQLEETKLTDNVVGILQKIQDIIES